MSLQSISILKKYKINITKPRIRMLDAFVATNRSLDLRYFLHDPAAKFERTTVFRTLRLFIEKKIVYRVSADGNDKYLLLQGGQSQLSTSRHSSFICIRCGKAVLIDTLEEPKLKIPSGFIKGNLDIIIHGLCSTCKS
jgi:Fur family transcriptional regulator, ferric uptake regulator